MRNGDVVMLALRPFFGKISGKAGVPVADILGCIEKGVAQVPGTAPRLAGRIGKQVQSLCGTAAVWGEFRPTMPLRKREGWPERRPPSRKTCPAVDTARRLAACRGGGRADPTPRTDQTPVRKRGLQPPWPQARSSAVFEGAAVPLRGFVVNRSSKNGQ